MSSVQTDIAPDNLPAHDSAQFPKAKEKTGHRNRLARRSHPRVSKTKLEELREKVRIHEQQVEKSTRAQSILSPTIVDTTSTPEAARYDSAGTVDFFMTPSSDINGSYALHEAEVLDHAAFLNFNDLATISSPARPSYAWTTPQPSQGSPIPFGSRSVVSEPVGFGFENAFYSPQSLHELSREPQQHSTEYVPQENLQRSVDASAPIEDRIRYVVDHAAAAGFDTLDEAIAAYYIETFKDTSPLCQDQRLRRNRRLPQLLSRLHNAAKGWDDWERQGFQEQITLSAEEILVKELNSFVTQHIIGTTRIETANIDLRGKEFGGGKHRIERQKIQDHLPNLWALTTALLAISNVLKQDTRPDADTALAIIENLCYRTPMT